MINASEKIFNDPNYRHYVMRYYGDVLKQEENEKDYIVTLINDKYGIVSTDKSIIFDELRRKSDGGIAFIEKANLYTLESINPIDAAGVSQIQNLESLSLSGEGVIVGILDTGINYLNKELRRDDGSTRVECIWDQTILNDVKIVKDNFNVPFGTVYTESEINEAIKAHEKGEDNKKIVPSLDDIGHGTKMACVIGGTGLDPSIKGAAPKCNFVVVKLQEDVGFKEELDVNVPMYNLITIFAGIDFLANYARDINKPMVIYLPVGNSFSNHKGGTLLERYIDNISVDRGIVIVTGSGNEGDTQCHTSGYLKGEGDTKDVILYIDPIQKNIATQIWVETPNVMSINIISPSGEETGVIPSVLNYYQDTKFIFENTKVSITYYLPDADSGDELIEIYFRNAQSGTWKIRLIGVYILDGRFDAWLPQKGITYGETQFIYSDPYGTLTSPGPSNYIINVANYDQTTNYLVNSSGRAFEDDVVDRVDIAAGGVNVLTSNVKGDGYSVVNGTSVSAAVVSGACALLLEWGIVKKNSKDMYSQKIKTFLIRGVQKRQGDIYPNSEFGYGILDMVKVFRNMT